MAVALILNYRVWEESLRYYLHTSLASLLSVPLTVAVDLLSVDKSEAEFAVLDVLEFDVHEGKVALDADFYLFSRSDNDGATRRANVEAVQSIFPSDSTWVGFDLMDFSSDSDGVRVGGALLQVRDPIIFGKLDDDTLLAQIPLRAKK